MIGFGIGPLLNGFKSAGLFASPVSSVLRMQPSQYLTGFYGGGNAVQPMATMPQMSGPFGVLMQRLQAAQNQAPQVDQSAQRDLLMARIHQLFH